MVEGCGYDYSLIEEDPPGQHGHFHRPKDDAVPIFARRVGTRCCGCAWLETALAPHSGERANGASFFGPVLHCSIDFLGGPSASTVFERICTYEQTQYREKEKKI